MPWGYNTMSWLCLWTDILDCPKLAELDDATIGGWVLILAATKRHDHAGLVPDIKRLAHWCRRPEMKIRAWISKLKDVELLDEIDGELMVHDWLDWQPRLSGRPATGNAKTHAQRQREYRDRQKASRDADVTSQRDAPSDSPIQENKRGEENRRHLTSRDENIKVTNKVTRDAIIVTPDTPPISSLDSLDSHFDANDRANCTSDVRDVNYRHASRSVTATLSHLCKSFDINCEQCRKDECIKQAGDKWGASNGEAVINDLLRTFPPEIVMESMDACWNRFQADLKPAYMRKCCEGKFRDHASKNGKV